MNNTAKQLQLKIEKQKDTNKQRIDKTIFDTHTEELIIGLCGPIGTDIHFVTESLKNILIEKFNYNCKVIKLSKLIKEHFKIDSTINVKTFEDYENLINKGNELRKEYGNNVLASLAINEIAVNRERKRKNDNFTSERVCYIIDSIKHKEELDLFRLIYSNIFYFFGVFSPIDLRIENLKNEKGLKLEEIHKLIDRDSGEELNFGQKVTDTFSESDFFMRIEDNSSKIINPKIDRYLNLIFNSSIETPTEHETAMHSAYSAAGNSACLSRQVGASITDSKGEILSVGWNDVPKIGGGVYQYDKDSSKLDKRCMNVKDGFCFNDREKNDITEDLVQELIDQKIVLNEKKELLIKIVKKSRIKELIEFSRAVHAEMLALILGCQKSGDRIINGKLYCTTYPCHNCARHIIAAGIKDVYYIEPYRKSLAVKLHFDSISENETETKKVRILMFDGVAPRRYLDFFRMSDKRKDKGKKIKHSHKNNKPKKTLSLQAIPILEKEVTKDLKNKNLL